MLALTVQVAVRGMSRRIDTEVVMREGRGGAREERKKTESLTTRL